MEPAAQCSYVRCEKPLRRSERFHYVPVRNAGLSVKWLINSGREDLLTYESSILESMNLAICSDHFQDNDYSDEGNLKEGTVPLQYWDLGFSRELGEIQEADIDHQLQNDSDNSFLSTDSEECEEDSEIGTDDEFRTQLGNEIEALLNSVQISQRQSERINKTDFGETLKSFYKKLNIKGDRCRNENHTTRMRYLVEFKRATKDICRTCAKKKINLIDIADKTTKSNIGILTKLKLLIEIEDHDLLPTKICQECLIRLEQSYAFFQQIYKADNILRDILLKHKQQSRTLSKKREYNGRVKDKQKSSRIKAQNFCLDVNDMPFKNNLKNTWMPDSNIDNGQIIDTYDSNGFAEDIHEMINVQEKSSINRDIDSSENTENTVSYLLSEFCNNDAELNWLDVVGVMKNKHKPDAAKVVKTAGYLPAGTLRISCKYCDMSFKLRRQLKTHITVDHLQPTNYMCEVCNICCKTKKHLSEHHEQAHSRQKYICNDCGEAFYKKAKLRIHIQRIHSTDKTESAVTEAYNTCGKKVSTADINGHITLHPDQIFTCNDCEETFSFKRTLRNHIHRLHSPFAYTCTICNKMMYSQEDTYKHMTMHDKSPLFPCLDCGRMFYSVERLEKHKSTHSKSTLKKRKRVWFHCQLCDASYRIAEELISHIETHTSDDWENYRNKILYCGECNARLIGNEKFLIHKMRFHLAKRGDFICLLCDTVTQDFQSLKEYERHVNLHSNELKRAAPRRYKCEHCDKAFKSNSHRINHTDSFHSDVMHSCPICNLKVKRKGNLKDHIDRVHSSKKQHGTIEVYLGEKRFPCRICGKELLTFKQRSEHEEMHQESLKDLEKSFPWTQKYTCDHCSRKFDYIHKLREHLIDEHGDNKNAAIIEMLEKHRKYKCIHCEATFKLKNDLDTHMKGVHSGIEHTCPNCGIKCKLASGLKKHLLTHDREIPLYKCQYCDKQFKNDERRKHHEVNHYTNNVKRFKEDLSVYDGE